MYLLKDKWKWYRELFYTKANSQHWTQTFLYVTIERIPWLFNGNICSHRYVHLSIYFNRWLRITTFAGPYTIFAPSNAAFQGFNISAYTREQLTTVLKYHVVKEFVLIPMIGTPTNKTTLEGQELIIAPTPGVSKTRFVST